MNIWDKAQRVHLQVSEDIKPGFDIGFDPEIPQEVRKELMDFMAWVEGRYALPVTLWVDFEYKHYLVFNGKRVGFRFRWADFTNYPIFDDPADIPEIRLPVRTGRYTMKEILTSFAEAITDYYMWICNELHEGDETPLADADEILGEYLKTHTCFDGSAES